jgi:Fe-S cluster biogenesis protein NfuA
MSGEKVFLSNPFESSPINKKPNDAEVSNNIIVESPELETRIMQLLEEYVSPAVAQDGGEIQFRSFRDGVVTVALRGSCSGCPSSTLTLKSGIENLLKSMMPEVKEVVAAAD